MPRKRDSRREIEAALPEVTAITNAWLTYCEEHRSDPLAVLLATCFMAGWANPFFYLEHPDIDTELLRRLMDELSVSAATAARHSLAAVNEAPMTKADTKRAVAMAEAILKGRQE